MVITLYHILLYLIDSVQRQPFDCWIRQGIRRMRVVCTGLLSLYGEVSITNRHVTAFTNVTTNYVLRIDPVNYCVTCFRIIHQYLVWFKAELKIHVHRCVLGHHMQRMDMEASLQPHF